MTIPFSFDWGKAFDTSERRVVLLNRQRAFLLKMANNAIADRFTFLTNFDESDYDDIDEFLSNLCYRLMDDETMPQMDFMSRQRLFADGIDNIGGTFAFQLDTAAHYNGYYTLTSVITSWVEWEHVSLKAGTYESLLYGLRFAGAGIASVKIGGGSPKTTIDMYNSTSVRNQKVYSSSFTIATDGEYNVRLAMDSKHASSSGYALPFNFFELVRTGD
jgi:hypothetical protein